MHLVTIGSQTLGITKTNSARRASLINLSTEPENLLNELGGRHGFLLPAMNRT